MQLGALLVMNKKKWGPRKDVPKAASSTAFRFFFSPPAIDETIENDFGSLLRCSFLLKRAAESSAITFKLRQDAEPDGIFIPACYGRSEPSSSSGPCHRTNSSRDRPVVD